MDEYLGHRTTMATHAIAVIGAGRLQCHGVWLKTEFFVELSVLNAATVMEGRFSVGGAWLFTQPFEVEGG
jgi:hypothetical protein